MMKLLTWMILICSLQYPTTLQGLDVNKASPAASYVKTASYGTWESPITAEMLAEGVTSTLNMLIDGKDTYWCEMRPSNKGRYTIVKRDCSGIIQDITPPEFNNRTFVHEYGGGAFTVREGRVYASSAADSKIYSIVPGRPPVPLTQGQTNVLYQGKNHCKGTRFADMHVTMQGIIAVGEQHEPGQPVENFLALIDKNNGSHKKIAAGYDFYSSPAISSDEKKIAWIAWNHPEMPWSNTELWVADINEHGELENQQRIAGDVPESIFQPQWSPEGILYFVTDRDRGWWNLHRYFNGRIENVCPMAAEIAEPLWVFGRSTYTFLGKKIVFAYNFDGCWHLGILDPDSKSWNKLEHRGTNIQHVKGGDGFVQFLESYPTTEDALVQIDDTAGYPSTILHAKKPIVDEGYVSKAQHIAFPSGSRTAFGFYYPPKNKDYAAPENEKPPLIVIIHGGPTAQAKGSFALSKQYWTSKGFAVLDINYGGSTGYGRDYRNLLNYNWGVVDVEDCVNGANYLVEQGLVDKNKLVIRGSSAGGYTTLAALAFRDTFKAGASYYGVADITALAHDTHKFEQRYMDHLVGKYPEEKKLWEARSPINSVCNIKSPLILFQGENDPIVPKNQSIMIYDALKGQNIPVEIHIYPGEEHGFRQAANIIHAFKREAEFYREVFKLNGKKSSREETPQEFLAFSRESWRQLRQDQPMLLTEEGIAKLQGQIEAISINEVEQIYLPLARLLNMRIGAWNNLKKQTNKFLGIAEQKSPYIIGITGSVAVGKSSTSRLLQALLSGWPEHRDVEIVNTDSFLFPNKVLNERNLMNRKGFPESYDSDRLIRFLSDFKSGKPDLKIPIYSHRDYDILSDRFQTVNQSDILIIEGLNILQDGDPQGRRLHQKFISDFIDFSIYVDANAELIKAWFLERFELFRSRAENDPKSYFYEYSKWDKARAIAFAVQVWEDINARNLNEHILPFRDRANLILHKGANHKVENISLRKF